MPVVIVLGIADDDEGALSLKESSTVWICCPVKVLVNVGLFESEGSEFIIKSVISIDLSAFREKTK